LWKQHLVFLYTERREEDDLSFVAILAEVLLTRVGNELTQQWNATGLVAALGGAGLTTLAGVLQGYPDIAQMLQMGGNYTVSSIVYKLIDFMFTLDRTYGSRA
jgi:hypothetical protein